MTLREFFLSEGIEEFSILDYSETEKLSPDKANRILSGESRTVVPFLMPYLVGGEKGNISIYARARDYHFYINELSKRLFDAFGDEFAVAGDTSPLNEVACAVRSGLGSIGRNGLLINEKYGSFVFLGEVFSTLPKDHPVFEGIERRNEGQFCLDCGRCERGCRWGGITDKSRCLSFINQKKRIDESEEEMIADSGIVWGCDDCQTVCPMNEGAKETPISFFRENRIPCLTTEIIEDTLKSGEFKRRAWAWRGEATVKRNAEIVGRKNEKQ